MINQIEFWICAHGLYDEDWWLYYGEDYLEFGSQTDAALVKYHWECWVDGEDV